MSLTERLKDTKTHAMVEGFVEGLGLPYAYITMKRIIDARQDYWFNIDDAQNNLENNFPFNCRHYNHDVLAGLGGAISSCLPAAFFLHQAFEVFLSGKSPLLATTAFGALVVTNGLSLMYEHRRKTHNSTALPD